MKSKIYEIEKEQLIEVFDTISEHEEQGCNPEEVASFVDLTVEEVELVKELSFDDDFSHEAMM
jgi:hypothetical protein